MRVRNKRTDDNQPEIVKALRRIGCTVAITSAAGDGFPDIVVGRTDLNGERKNWLLEIKDGDKVPSKQVLTPDQERFHSKWRGQIDVVNSSNQAINLIMGIGKA